ncbi:hypothetical protein CBR_g16972 [Chara braunii]|uniref:PspA/IM30 family protein n=1 Tax=Chara braunii TaxID=69332 RepID=A0A388KUB4_CHABU|nr:hypothetical protein CBR_g16972 [Chara braunii]|eukprot:GBG73629.1 hypothetical protein CBR_g16972 [Chara braunii]
MAASAGTALMAWRISSLSYLPVSVRVEETRGSSQLAGATSARHEASAPLRRCQLTWRRRSAAAATSGRAKDAVVLSDTRGKPNKRGRLARRRLADEWSTHGSVVARKPGPCAAIQWKLCGGNAQQRRRGDAGGRREWQSRSRRISPPARTRFMRRRSSFIDGVGGRESESCALLLHLPFVDGKKGTKERKGGGGGGGGGVLGARMSIFDRMARVIRSYTNALLNDMEDPEKVLDQTVMEMEEDLSKMKKGIVKVMGSLKRLEDVHTGAESSSAQWHRRAKLAMSNGDEALAMAALRKKKEIDETASARTSDIERQREAIKKLRESMVTLEKRIAEAKSKKEPLKARAKSAKLGRQVAGILGGSDVGVGSALTMFEEMEAKVMAMEAEAEALGELTAAAGEDDVASQFLLTEGNISVDEELEALKKEMAGTTSIKGLLPPGRTGDDGAAASSQSRDDKNR